MIALSCTIKTVPNMANFKTHLFVTTSVSATVAAVLYSNNLIELADSPWFVFLASVGGILPDIDSDNSRPLKFLFIAFAMLAAALAILVFKNQYELLHLAMIAVGTFLTVRYPMLILFSYFTVHRGIFHSLLSAVFFILITVYISHTQLHNTVTFSWISGLFIGLGVIVHLILDECYSVNLGNFYLKRSFGTAFKLFSVQYLHASVVMLIACILLYIYIPTFPFQHQQALTIVNLVLESSISTFEKYFFKLPW